MTVPPPDPDRPPPTGTVAFLFTDIEGSTQLWEERPQAMAMALRRHDELVRTLVVAYGGHIFSTGGDGFGMAFPTVDDALKAAIAVQRALHLDPADAETAIKVRMGVHAGTGEERDGDYFGPVVNRGARIMTAAHGGQILISARAAEMRQATDEPQIELRELGSHRLRDLLTPESILQVTVADLPSQFPPLRSRRAGNIPLSFPAAVGRDLELDEIIDALSTSRLVTVVSAVSRSAASICFGVARSVDQRFPHGAWHLDLAPLDRRGDLAPALAAALGIVVESPADGQAPTRISTDEAITEIADALLGQHALLVLEGGTLGGELADAVAELLPHLPSVSILVASPTPLGLAGETPVVVLPRALPPDLQRFRLTPLIEREIELATLRDEFSRTAGGERRLVMIAGEEGIGKSRLVAELAAEVVADDGLVLRGAWDEEAITDFQAFREAFTRYLEEVDRRSFRTGFGNLLPDLDAFVSKRSSNGTAARNSDLPDGSADDGSDDGNDIDRYRLLDALDSWLAQVASVQPVLLWLDDLQWADPSSLQMIQHLARSPRPAPLLIVVTFQPNALSGSAEISHALTQLHRSPGFEQIDLTGLSTRASATLINNAETALAPRSVLLMHEWSGGNPYFLQELMHLIDESAAPDGPGGQRSVADLEDIGVPESIADVVRWRLARRSARLAELLTVASAIGTTFDTQTLAALLDTDADEIDELLDEGLRFGFIDEEPGSDDLFSFRKDLVRQALYQALRPRARTRLHRRVLEQLLEQPEPDPSAVARHLSIVAGPDDLDRTVEFATSAAQRATDQMAFENAARHYDQALQVLDRFPEPDGPRIELLIEAGKAHNRGGALNTGRAHLQRAAGEARRRNRPDLLAEAGLAWGGVLPSATPPDPEAVELLREIVDAFPGDSPERARALVRQAEWLHREATHDERRALVDEALAIAERLGDPAVLGWVLNSSMLAMLSPDDAVLAPAVAERIIALSTEAKDDELAFQGWKLLLQGLFASGRMDEIHDVAATVRRLGEHLREPEYLRIAIMWDATVANLEGRFDDARQRVNEALTVTLTGDHSQVAEIQLMLRVPRFGLQGATTGIRSMLDALGTDNVRAFRAWFHAEAGDLDLARPLEQVPGLVAGIAEKRWYMFWADVVGLGTAAALLGDADQARQLRDLITPYRDNSAVLGIAAFLGTATHHRGVLSGVLAEWDEAVADLELAVERHQAMNARPWTALSQIELARVLDARGGPGDETRAADLTAAAVAVADELQLSSVHTRLGRPIATTPV
jgi:class 3 adenylate cyclase/tetratricopeptide (TPR) repeat protein